MGTIHRFWISFVLLSDVWTGSAWNLLSGRRRFHLLPSSEYDRAGIHEHFMSLALAEAQRAGRRGEVPIGAVVVRYVGQDKYEVLATGANGVETHRDASAHAELVALRRAARRVKNWRLLNCTLYSTLEPCSMCLSACLAFRIDSIVYGAPDLRLGAVETQQQMLVDVAHPFHNVTSVVAGVQREESAQLLRDFFRDRRDNKGPVPGKWTNVQTFWARRVES